MAKRIPMPLPARPYRLSPDELDAYSGGLLKTGRLHEDDRIVVFEGNPHKVGEPAHRRYALLRNGLSIEAYMQAVADTRSDRDARVDLYWWREHGSIGIVDGSAAYGPEPEPAEPLPAAPEPAKRGVKLSRKAAAGLGRSVGKAVARG